MAKTLTEKEKEKEKPCKKMVPKPIEKKFHFLVNEKKNFFGVQR